MNKDSDSAMRLHFVKMSRDRLDHERIWGAIGLALSLMWIVFPLENVVVRCPFRMVTGLPCPTCGMTRSLVHLRQLDLLGAFAANPLIAALALFAAAYCIYAWIVLLSRAPRIRVSITRWWEPALVRALVIATTSGNWIYLLLTGK